MYRVAKNALFLYARTIVNTVVGIFTVQIMLEALGVDDYGLQAVAGVGTGLFTFLIQVLGTSTSRFLTFELGRGDEKRTNDTFCTTLILYIGLGILMAIIAETVGMWVLHNKLQVPDGRMHAAEFIIHISAISALVTLPQTPYSAVLNAHEKFNITASLSLFGTFYRLAILLLIVHSGFDHLILYTLLMFLLSVANMIFIRIYCRRYPECRFRPVFSRTLMRPILRFSAWELLGAISRTLKATLYPMFINIFHGVRLNVAIGIGSTLSGAVTGMAFTITSAFKPVITKLFAADRLSDMKDSVVLSTQLSMILYGIFAAPLLAMLDYVMTLWLHDVPPLALELCAIQLVINSVLLAYLIPAEGLKSMGRNKGTCTIEFIQMSIFSAILLTVLYLGMDPLIACAVYEAGTICSFILSILLVRRHLGGAFVRRLVNVAILRVLIAEGVIFLILFTISHLLPATFLTLVLVCTLSVILFGAASLFWILEPDRRESLRLLIRTRLQSIFPRPVRLPR